MPTTTRGKPPLPSSHAITPLCSVPYSCSVREASCSARMAQSRHSEPCTAGDGIEEPLSPHRNFAPRALPLAYSQLGDCARHPTTLSHFQLVWWSLETAPGLGHAAWGVNSHDRRRGRSPQAHHLGQLCNGCPGQRTVLSEALSTLRSRRCSLVPLSCPLINTFDPGPRTGAVSVFASLSRLLGGKLTEIRKVGNFNIPTLPITLVVRDVQNLTGIHVRSK